jgi:hypothetical protein
MNLPLWEDGEGDGSSSSSSSLRLRFGLGESCEGGVAFFFCFEEPEEACSSSSILSSIPEGVIRVSGTPVDGMLRIPS